LLVAFSAVLLPRPAATPPTPHPSREGNASTKPAIESQTGPAAGSPTECTDCLDGPIRLYREFSGRTRQSPAAENLALVGEKISDPRYDRRFTIFSKRAPSTGPQALRTDEELSSIKGDLQLTGYRLEFLVALVPDPLDSSLAELFDGGIRGIEDALARSGYLLDRLWFPWDKTEDKNSGAESKQHRLSPGVLLFRRNEPPAHPGDLASRHLLTVLIVGETPKQGVHKTAFHQALRLVRALSDEGNAPLRVLGPSFSGSAESLRIALQGDWLARGGRFTFVSGTATAAGIAHLSPFSLPGITFCRTVPSDSKLTTAAVGFLSEGLGWECGKLALLTERDTAFGTKSSISCGPGARGLRKPLVEIPFLSGLAELRTAREENGTGATPKPDRTGIQVPPSSLALSLAEKRYPVDVVREQSPLTPAADDLALANLFSTMAREDIR